MLGAPSLLLVHPTFFENVQTAPLLFYSLKTRVHSAFRRKRYFLPFSLLGVFFSCNRWASVKVKVSLFVVAMVGSSSATYEVCICAGCAWVGWCTNVIRMNFVRKAVDPYVDIAHIDQVDPYNPYGSS